LALYPPSQPSLEHELPLLLEREEEVLRLEIGFIRASTTGMVHSIEVVDDYMAKMVGW